MSSSPPLTPPRSVAPEPPHPFRTPAWFDPRIEHQPCQCPACRPRPRARRFPSVALRVILVVLGGVLLPLVSLVLNEELHVVHLQAAGSVGLIFTVINTLAHLILWPVRREPGATRLSHRPPRSTPVRVVLTWSALLSAVYWGYLALLFIPLTPLSVIGIAFMGIGLCGLCPYGALFIALRQAIRGVRSLGRPWGWINLLACLSLIAAALGGLAAARTIRHHEVMALIQRVAALAPYSAERMALIQQLAGEEERLVESYLREDDFKQRATMAEVYLRLTDTTLNQQVTWRGRERSNRAINPWWFLQGTKIFPDGNPLWRF